MRSSSKIVLCAFLCCSVFNQAAAQCIKHKARLPEVLSEVSGTWHAGTDSIYWLNDGGNAPALYLTDYKGNLKQTIALSQLPNKDWEELTGDEAGNLYIGDFGNNCNCRKDLRIYSFHPGSQAMDSILFHFPEQTAFPPTDKAEWRYDVEAFVYLDGFFHLFTKVTHHSKDFVSYHYKVPARPGKYTAQLVQKLLFAKQFVTGAALSPDKKKMVFTSYYYRMGSRKIPKTSFYMWMADVDNQGNILQNTLKSKKMRQCVISRQTECVGFCNAHTIFVANERTPMHKNKIRCYQLNKKKM